MEAALAPIQTGAAIQSPRLPLGRERDPERLQEALSEFSHSDPPRRRVRSLLFGRGHRSVRLPGGPPNGRNRFEPRGAGDRCGAPGRSEVGSPATTMMPSSKRATAGEARRKYRCRPRGSTASSPACVSLPRWPLAVDADTPASWASSVAVRARPSISAMSILARPDSPTRAAIAAIFAPVVMRERYPIATPAAA